MNASQSIYSLLFLFFGLGLGSCSPIYDGDGGCPGSYYDQEIMGEVNIDTGSRVWTDPASQSVRFINSNGGDFVFVVNLDTNKKESELLYTDYDDGKECTMGTEFYAYVGKDKITYTSAQVPFSILITRSISPGYEEALQSKNATSITSERFNFKIGTGSLFCKSSDTSRFCYAQYLLLDSIYKDVFVYENSRVEQGLYPTKFILQRGRGLIGFELSNKEVWAVK